ncbi:MAG: 4-hydroxy-tetrahydrodipicolinate reductase [Clostridia bacterium]|nr:4-hydroxy-tetrahydrodipicolinate reductase [Clostridia bacterium]
MTKIRIGLCGARGRMCEAVARIARCSQDFEIAFGVDRRKDLSHPYFPIFDGFGNLPSADAIIDFSSPTLTSLALDYASETGIPIVVATTGQPAENVEKIRNVSKSVPVFFDSNTSYGNCLLMKLAKVAAEFLDESFDIEIVETHHRIKSDAPSGTALHLSKVVQEAKREAYNKEYTISQGHASRRQERQIGVHSLRGGTVVGKHEILFLGNDERIVISHEVENKSVFAHGALRAAKLLLTAPAGLYDMNDFSPHIGFSLHK